MLKRKIVCVRVRADQPFFSGGFRLFRRRRENVCACECRKFVCVCFINSLSCLTRMEENMEEIQFKKISE